jgi:cytochrome c oxidase cbb3-type subunit 4
MIKNVLTHIGGIEAYGIISISLFFVFFTGMLIWAFRLDRRDLDAIGRLPLGDDSSSTPRSHSQPDSAHECE